MKVIVCAVVAQGGVIGRTRKPCERCGGYGSENIAPKEHAPVYDVCFLCEGQSTIPANDLPWGRAYPEIDAHIDALSMGHAAIAGRATAEGMAKRWPLKGRLNVVVSSEMSKDTPGMAVQRTLAGAIATVSLGNYHTESPRDAFVVGGVRLFTAALPLADGLDLTFIDKKWEGDVRFPNTFERDGVSFNTPSSHFDQYSSFELVHHEVCPTNPEIVFTAWRRP